MEDKKIEERIKWLKAINKNYRVRKRAYQSHWDLVDSEGYKLDLRPCVDPDAYYFNPSLVILDFPLSKYDEHLSLNEYPTEHDKLSRLEASLVLGKDSQIYAEMRNCEPRFDEYSDVENWELQAMLFAATSVYSRAHYYSFGRFSTDEPKDKSHKLVIPVQYYIGGRVKDSERFDEKPIIDLGSWSERKLIKQVREELRKNAS